MRTFLQRIAVVVVVALTVVALSTSAASATGGGPGPAGPDFTYTGHTWRGVGSAALCTGEGYRRYILGYLRDWYCWQPSINVSYLYARY